MLSSKAFFVLCAQALLIQLAFSQCTSPAAVAAAPGLNTPYGIGAGLGYNGLATPYGLTSPAIGMGYNGLGYNGLGYNSLAYDGIGCGYAQALDFTPTSGGGLPVTSASVIPPVGISVASDNIYEGALAVAGELPFVGTVAFENVLPTAGAGVVNHACGNGVNAMVSDSAAFAPAIAPVAAITPVNAALAPMAGYAPSAYGAPGLGYYGGCAGSLGYVI